MWETEEREQEKMEEKVKDEPETQYSESVTAKKTCSTTCSWHSESPMKLVVLLKPFSKSDSTQLWCTVTVHTAQSLCQKIYICRQVEFGWQLDWSMLHVNCMKLTEFFLQLGRGFDDLDKICVNDQRREEGLLLYSTQFVLNRPSSNMIHDKVEETWVTSSGILCNDNEKP